MATRRGMVVLVDMVAGEDVLVDGRREAACVFWCGESTCYGIIDQGRTLCC